MRTFLITILITFSFSLCAQQHFIGVKGGNNWTNIFTTSSYGLSSFKTGFSGGISYSFLKKRKLFEVDFLYSEKKFHFVSLLSLQDVPSLQNEIIARINYLSVPFKVGYALGTKLFCSGAVGIVPSMLLRRERATLSFEFFDNASKFDLAVLAELSGGYFVRKKLCLFSAFAYQPSVTSIIKGYSIYPYSMTLSLGIKYTLTKEKKE